MARPSAAGQPTTASLSRQALLPSALGCVFRCETETARIKNDRSRREGTMSRGRQRPTAFYVAFELLFKSCLSLLDLTNHTNHLTLPDFTSSPSFPFLFFSPVCTFGRCHSDTVLRTGQTPS